MKIHHQMITLSMKNILLIVQMNLMMTNIIGFQKFIIIEEEGIMVFKRCV